MYLSIVGAVVAAGLVVVVTAAASGVDLKVLGAGSPSKPSSPGASSTSGQAYCDRYISHVAANLGKSPDQVKKAMTDALNQSLADAVKAGELTQQQADAIKARDSGKSACAAAEVGAAKPHAGTKPAAAGRVGLGEYAKALGISEQELRQDLGSGKTVKDIAASKGIDENAFRDKLISSVKSDLDPQVAAGKLTQQQEDEVLNKLKSNPLPLWDKPVKKPTSPAQSTS